MARSPFTTSHLYLAFPILPQSIGQPNRPTANRNPPLLPLYSTGCHGRSLQRWLCLRPPEQLKPEERLLLDKLLSQDEELARGYALLQRFRQIVRERDRDGLACWLEDAKSSVLPTFIALANGIEHDQAVEDAAFRLPWSNGPVEGVITKVKLIKRQGYGRAKFDLLRIRVLAA